MTTKINSSSATTATSFRSSPNNNNNNDGVGGGGGEGGLNLKMADQSQINTAGGNSGGEEMELKPKDFLERNTIPCFAKIAFKDPRINHNKRPTMTTTAENDNDDENVCSDVVVFVHSMMNACTVVVAEEMNIIHRKHIQSTGQRFHIPIECKGWFEVVSQDGISARPLLSVVDLSQLATSTRCLVRQTVVGYSRKEDGYDSQVIKKGEILTLLETVWISTRTSGVTFNKQLLRCIDHRGQEVYLGLDQKGLFSPIAGNTSVTGAHGIQSLLCKFRLPVMVRLLYGNVLLSSGSQYSTGVFKLLRIFSDDLLFLLPLLTSTTNNNTPSSSSSSPSGAAETMDKQQQRIVALPMRAKSIRLKYLQSSSLAAAVKLKIDRNVNNEDTVRRLKKRCKTLIAAHLGIIASKSALYESPLLTGIEIEPPSTADKKKSEQRLLPRSSSPTTTQLQEDEEDRLFREVEDIYSGIGGNILSTRPPNQLVSHTSQHFNRVSAVASGGHFPKGLKRNVTDNNNYRRRARDQQKRTTHVIDDNWKMTSRPMMTKFSTFHHHSKSERNIERITELEMQTNPNPTSDRNLKAGNIHSNTINNVGRKARDPIYEEIPFFSQENITSASSMDLQKTIYISDTSIYCQDSTHDNDDDDDDDSRKNRKKNTLKEPLPTRPRSSLADYPDKGLLTLGNNNSSVIRPHDMTSSSLSKGPQTLSSSVRPLSYAGSPLSSNETTIESLLLLDSRVTTADVPPPLPPKRGESMCNLLVDSLATESKQNTTEEAEERKTSPTIFSEEFPMVFQENNNNTQMTTTRELEREPSGGSSSSPPPPPLTQDHVTVERRPSKKSNAAKTFGNVSRTLLNTFRRIGHRSSGTLIINSSSGGVAGGGGGAEGEKNTLNGGGSESVAALSSSSSPEPQSTSSPNADSKPVTRGTSFTYKPQSSVLIF